MNFFKKQAGFTLIELLVVISIIGLLSAVVYANFGDARAQSRDKVRMTSIKELQLAIEFYKAQNGRYPSACRGSDAWSGQQGSTYACPAGNKNYIVGLAPDFISELPIDPLQPITGDRGIMYRTDTDGTTFKLLVHDTVEKLFVTSYDDEFARCPRSFGSSFCPVGGPQQNSYAVYGGAGAASW